MYFMSQYIYELALVSIPKEYINIYCKQSWEQLCLKYSRNKNEMILSSMKFALISCISIWISLLYFHPFTSPYTDRKVDTALTVSRELYGCVVWLKL